MIGFCPLQIVAANETYLNLTPLSPICQATSVIDEDNDNITFVTWKFKYSGYPRPQFNWYFKKIDLSTLDTTDIELYRDMDKQIIDENVAAKELTLKLKRPLQRNFGEYTLVAENGFRKIEQTIYYGSTGIHLPPQNLRIKFCTSINDFYFNS